MVNDKSVTPERVIGEFAALIATEETAGTLAEILKFVENDSNYEDKLPKNERIEPFETRFSGAEEALEALAEVRALGKPGISLPISPDDYLNKLTERLNLMKK